MCVFGCPGGEEVHGGVGFGGGSGGGQRDAGREQRGAETKAIQQEGQRLVCCLSQNTQSHSYMNAPCKESHQVSTYKEFAKVKRHK